MKKQGKKKKASRGLSWQAPKRSNALVWLVSVLGVAIVVAGIALERSDFAKVHTAISQNHAALRISEVQSDNGSTLRMENGELPDWIEIENIGREEISLKGVSLMLNQQFNKMLSFPNITLGGGESLLVYADANSDAEKDGRMHAPFRLPASGCTLSMFEGGNNILDMVVVPELKRDYSYCRVDEENWEMSAQATPGSKNQIQDYREIDINIQPGDVEITEVVTANRSVFANETGKYCDYVEIHNTSSATINLEGYWLTDDTSKPDKWVFPAVQLPADGYLALHCAAGVQGNSEYLHTGFGLSSDGESIYLYDPQATVVSAVAVPMLEPDKAYSLVNGEWTTIISPTPNKENSHAAAAQLDAELRAENNSAVIISEIMASPEDEEYDWVELYNTSSQAVDLSGYGFSDNSSHPRKWQFPQGSVIGAGKYLAVFLVGNADAAVPGYICAPFSLAAEGGYSVCLATPEGKLLDHVYLPQQIKGIPYGRSSAGECGYLSKTTPGAANDAECLPGMADSARYSVAGGLYTKGDVLSVELFAGEGERIYYTLDCSNPDQNSTLYTGTPITIDSTTILRTRVYRDGYLPSLMKTQSYLYNVKNAEDAPYVVSLVSDPDGLFGYKRGIMVKGPNARPTFPYGAYGEGANFWMDWEREAHIEFFTSDGQTPISQECGIKIHGRNSRAYELKPLKVIARASYGDADFSHSIFPDREYDNYESFILRYAGQDYKYAFMRDVVLTSLAADTGVMYQEAVECICYLNGKYYSTMYVREHMNTFAICRFNGWEGQEDNIDLVKGANGVMQGSNDTYKALEDWLDKHKHDTQECYEAIDSIIDIDNFIEYCTLQIFIGTPDTVNVKRYRNPNGDGKWRWILYDVDRAMRRERIDGFKNLAQGTNARLFQACMHNSIIRERFLKHLNEQLSTTLSAENVVGLIQEQYNRIMPLMDKYLDMMDISKSDYKSMVESFAREVERRHKQVLGDCASYLDIPSSEMKQYFRETYEAIENYKSPF